MKRILCFLCLTAIAVGAMGMPLHAGSVWGTWTGAVDTDYYNPLNWLGNDGVTHLDGVSNNWLRVDDNGANAPIISTTAPWVTYNLWVGSAYAPNPVGPGPWFDGFATPTTTAGKLTIADGGTLVVNYPFDVGCGPVTGTSSLIMTGNAHVTHASAYEVRIGINGASSEFSMSGTSVFDKWNGGEMLFGVNDGSALSATSTVVTLSDSAFLHTSAHYRFGDNATHGGTVAATGTFTMTGNSHVQNWNRQIVIGNGALAEGTVTLTGDGLTAGVQPFFENIGSGCATWVGATGGTASLTVTNALYTDSGIINVGVANGTGTFTASTTAGSLTPTVISAAGINGGNGSGTVRFDNVTVKAMASNDSFMNNTSTFNVYIEAGGVTFDTNGSNIGVYTGLKEGTTTGGGLTKTGLGTLTLKGANTYTGLTDVKAGQLTLATGIVISEDTVVPGLSFALTNNIRVRPGAAVGTDAASYAEFGTVNANLVLDAKSIVSLALDGGDFLRPLQIQDLSAGTTGQPVTVKLDGIDPSKGLMYVGSSVPIVNYISEGANGDVPTFVPWLDSYGTWEVSIEDNGSGVVNMGIKDSLTTRGWKANAGNWTDNANWYEGTAPNGTGDKAWFTQSVGGLASTVTLNDSVTVSSMLFDANSSMGYTITPTAAQTITLQTSIAADTQIQVLSGDHVINANIIMAAGDPIINIADGQKLTLNGNLSDLSGPATITFKGNGNGMSQTPHAGTLELNGLNSFTGAIVMSSYGRLAINNIGPTTSPNALGQSSADPANLVINGILSYTGTSATPVTVTTDRGFTLAGTTDPYNLGAINVIEVQDANVNVKFNGVVTTNNYSMFRKAGAGKLTFANPGVNMLAGCDFQVAEGALVLENGTFNKSRVNVAFQNGYGEFYVGDAAGKTGAVVIQNGATLNLTDASEPTVGFGAGTTGSITLNDNAKIVSSSHYRIGYTDGTGTLTLNGSSSIKNTNHQIVIGNIGGANGSVALNGDGLTAGVQPVFENLGGDARTWVASVTGATGSLSITNAKYVEGGFLAISAAGGNGTLTVATTPGSLNPGTLDITAYLLTSYNEGTGISEVNVTAGSTLKAGGWMGIGYNDGAPSASASGHSVFNNSGTVEKNATFAADVGFLIIGRSQDAVINQNAGSFTDATITCLGQWGNKGTLNLNGGVFSTIAIQVGYWPEDIAKGEINFDGGTLKANPASIYAPAPGGAVTLFNPYQSAAGNANIFVKNGGAVIDSSGFAASILVPLQAAPDSTGGLTKIGLGSLTLVAGNTYIGDTVVDAGTLNIPAINTPSAEVYVATDAVLNTASIVANTLTIGGAPRVAASASSVTAVPEPSTLVLLALAGMALVGAYIRRR
jgi:autotransporter-associated beta strand protein